MKKFVKKLLGITEYDNLKHDRIRRVYRKTRDRYRLMFQRLPCLFSVETSTFCQSLCDYCARTHMVADGRLKPSLMDMNTFRRIIGELKTLRGGRILQLGVGLGEPFTDPLFFVRFDYAKAELPSWKFTTVTNGIGLAPGVQKRLIGNFDRVTVSLNSFDRELYCKINGVDQFDRVVSQLNEFLVLKGNRKPAVSIQLLDMDFNKPCFESFRSYWLPRLNRNDLLFYKSFENSGGENDFQKYVHSSRTVDRRPCFLPWELVLFSVEGDVYPCCLAVIAPGLKIGNVLEEPLKAILRGEKLERLKMALLTGSWFEACVKCNIWEHTAGPFFKVGRRWH